MIELGRDVIDSGHVRLREPREYDADEITAACDDPTTHRFLPALPDPYTPADAVWWINEGAPAAWRGGGTAYVMVNPQTDRVIGGIGINRVIGERLQGEIGYWVAPWARGQGIARTATVALTEWAFQRGFGRMELLTEVENSASQRVALAAGYRYEGVRRAAGVGRGGIRHDLVAWARLDTDPPGPTPRLLPDLPGNELTDGVVLLQPLRESDAADAYELQRLPEVMATTLSVEALDEAGVRRICARAQSRWLAGERVDLVIRDAATAMYAGEIGLYYQEPVTGQAMIGYSMLPRWRGRGYATRAVRLLAAWAFESTDIARLVAGTAPDNVGSQRVLQGAGFTREGVSRGRLPVPSDGRADDLLYGLLPGDLKGRLTPPGRSRLTPPGRSRLTPPGRSRLTPPGRSRLTPPG